MIFVKSLTVLLLVVITIISNNISSIERVWADEVIATIKVGERPNAIQYNPSNGYIYVANSESNSVSVIDSSTHEVIKTIDVEEYPWALGYNPDSNYVYVSNRHSDSVSIIDGTSNEILKTVKVGISPFVIEYNPIKNAMYVSNQGSHSVSVIDGANNEVVDTIGDIYTPQDVLFNPDNGNLYVSGYAHNTISIIDGHTNELVKEVGTVGSGPYDIEYDPQNKCIYIGNGNTADVTVLDTTTNEIVKRIDVGGIDGGPSFILDQVKYNPYNDYIYVSDGWRNHLSIIDGVTNELIQEIDITAGGGSVYNPTNHDMYTIGNGVAIIDSSTNKVLQTVNTPPGGISTIEYNPSDENIYTANNGAASVSVISKSSTEPLIPKADSGPDQTVGSGDTVQLDGSGSSDPSDRTLIYKWTQIGGPEVTLSNDTSVNPTFTAPEVKEQANLTFQLTVTNNDGTASEPDVVVVTINPIQLPPPEEEEPKTIGDLIKGIIQNPLDVANSIDSANQIKDILTDDNRNNDQLVCDLINPKYEHTANIRDILNC